jgi:hypothetical protein
MIRFFATASIATIAVSLVGAAGCSSINEEELGNVEQASTPSAPPGTFGLAESCSRLFKRHASLRPLDLDQGLIRWGCGDVPGVTEPDFGQEYCEYQAVQNGKSVRKAADLTTGKVSCVFTAVFTGAGQAPRLKAAMADPANLGVTPATDGIVQMQKGFNSRSAATTLVSDCSRQPAAAEATRRQRVTAIFLAYAKGGPNAARLKEIGTMTSISDAAWQEAQALGVKIAAPGDADLDEQRDITSCMSVRGAGVAWRNSDPMICARVNRSAGECSCRFGAVPSSLQGFPFSGWVDDQIPTSCRLAKVDGADYPFIAICDLTDQEVSDLPLNPAHARSLQSFCHDRFGTDIVMKIPLRPLQQTGTCSNSAGFCEEYMGMDAVPMEAEASAPDARETTETGSRRAR